MKKPEKTVLETATKALSNEEGVSRRDLLRGSIVGLASLATATALAQASTEKTLNEARSYTMTLKGIHHFALVVPDVESASQWYQNTLGFTLERRFDVEDFGTKFIHLVHASGIRLELMSRTGSKPSPDLDTDAFGSLLTQGAKHIGILVENIEELEQELQAKGIEIIHPVTTVEIAGVKNFWIRDNAGNLIEFNQWLS